MLYTDKKVIIDENNDAEVLESAVQKLKDYILENYGVTAEFELDETKEGPCYKVPPGVYFYHIENALRPNVRLSAINEDELTGAETIDMNVQHIFTEDELHDLATNITKDLTEVERLKEEKASVTKEYANKIKKLETQIKLRSQNHQQEFEYRDKKCTVKFDFNNKTKIFIDSVTEEVVKTEEMKGRDFQLRIDHDFAFRPNPKVEEGSEEEGMSGNLVDEALIHTGEETVVMKDENPFEDSDEDQKVGSPI